ncbi:MAG: hypothetical protein HFJ27_03550 [Clostridia bacterium]|nr:hypothetical protein [Clostridia bacterium]
MSIVHTNIPYHSSILENNLKDLLQEYPFLNSTIIGYSVLGKPLYSIRFGNGSKEVFYAASFHANEWITSPILMKFIEDVCKAFVSDSNILGLSARELLRNTTFHLCPMVNPDGVDLVTDSLDKNSSSYLLAQKIADSYPTIPFPNGWKANIKGVDLNLQFPARMGKCKGN